MSIGNVRAVDRRDIAAFISGVIVVVAGVSCIVRGGDDQPNGDLDKYFLRDVAKVEAMGLPVYWLGREFTAGGLTFQGPYGGEFGGEVEGGGIDMDYVSWLDGTPFEGTNIGLKIIVYGPNAWELASGRIMTPPRRASQVSTA